MRSIVIGWVLCAGICLATQSGVAAAGAEPAAEPVSESIPFKQQPAVGYGSVQRVALVLLLAIGVCFVAALLLRKELGKRGLLSLASSDRIAVVASRRIAPRLTVFLINIDEQAYVVVQSGNDMQLAAHGSAAQAELEG